MKTRLKHGLLFAGMVTILVGLIGAKVIYGRNKKTVKPVISNSTPTPVVASPTPTLRPLTFEEMNKKYGPCVKLPVLMYHHIQEDEIAKERGQGGLSTSPEWLANHFHYLKDKGYSVVPITDIALFFDEGKQLPKKAAAITLDDAYEDNYLYAWNIFKEFGSMATIFTPTGLVMVHDYLTWDEIKEMNNSGLVYFGNHTWSHHGSYGGKELLEKEISLADGQLSEKGLNPLKIFAYPYGKPNKDAISVLQKLNYRLAFTTNRGSTLCKGKRYELPRIRVGNAPLSSFGL